MATILVVDDELGIRALLSDILSDEGHTVEVAENAAQARIKREQCNPDLVLLDIWMPDVDGVTLLKEWGANGQLHMPVIMMSGHGTIDTAVEATKVGAHAFLEKPITMQKLLKAVETAIAKPGTAPASASSASKSLMAIPSPAHAHMANVTPITAAASYNSANHGMAMARHDSMAATSGLMSNNHLASPPAPSMAPPTHHGPAHEQLFSLDRPLREARDDFERAYFEFHLAREGGSMTRVAEKTGLERTHLYRKLKQLGVDLTRNRKAMAH